jgi:tetratricopeptide (TPR) repeat protein
VVKKFNQNSDAFMYRGKANYKLGKVREALSDYEDAIRLNPDNGQAYLYRGILYVQTKRKKSACADFQKAKGLRVADADAAITKYCKKK